MTDTTLIIKAFERPGCLDALLASIRRFYPSVPILVGDDSRVPHPIAESVNVSHIALPHDVGLAEGRNRLLAAVQTEFFVLLDDDYVFTPATRLELLYDALLQGYDIVGGNVIDANGRRTCNAGKLCNTSAGWPAVVSIPNAPTVQTCEFVPNFFIGRSEAVRKVGWTSDYKIGAEHSDFFMRARGVLRVGFLGTVTVEHRTPVASPIYRAARSRASTYMEMFKSRLLSISNPDPCTGYRGSARTPRTRSVAPRQGL